MGVSEFTYDKGMVEAALFRSGGTKLERYAYGPALPPSMRNPRANGRGVGHVYIHVKGGGDDVIGANSGRNDRSLFADTRTLIDCVVEIMKNPTVRAALLRLDQDPQPNDQEWLKNIPVIGNYYGYSAGQGDYPRKITTVAINMRSHGDALFISSCYPDGFQTGPSMPLH